MLTPQEVAEHAFAKASFGGYNMAMVDEFLDLLTADYTTLYKENATLKAKMKVLADKVEEYRSTDDAMRKALLSAQKMADDIVKDAEKKKVELTAAAEREAKERIEVLRTETENEQLRLTAARNATAAYLSKLKDLYQHEMDYLAGLSKLNTAPVKPDPVARTAEAIGDAVEKAVEEVPDEEPEPLEESPLYEELRRGVVHLHPEADDDDDDDDDEPAGKAAQEEEEEEEEEDATPTRRIDFDNLKFGKDYEIT